MNSAVVKNVEYRKFVESEFSELEIVPHSGEISEKNERTRAGILFSTEASFKIAKSSVITDSILKDIVGKQAR